jgi:hypothetical protein
MAWYLVNHRDNFTLPAISKFLSVKSKFHEQWQRHNSTGHIWKPETAEHIPTLNHESSLGPRKKPWDQLPSIRHPGKNMDYPLGCYVHTCCRTHPASSSVGCRSPTGQRNQRAMLTTHLHLKTRKGICATLPSYFICCFVARLLGTRCTPPFTSIAS